MTKLNGMDEITEFAEKSAAILTTWKRDFGFPMVKDKKTLTWYSTESKIKKWYKDRGVNPKTVSDEALLKYRNIQLRKAGKAKLHKKTLNGFNEILDFAGIAAGTLVEWQRYVDCPIKKVDHALTVDADEFQAWMEKHNLI